MIKNIADVVQMERSEVEREFREKFEQLTTEHQNLVIAFMMGIEIQNIIEEQKTSKSKE